MTHLVLLTAIHFKCIKILIYFLVIPYQEGTYGITLGLIGMHIWRSFVMSSVSRGSTECHYKHSTNLFLFYHLRCREIMCTPIPSHLLSLLALESGTWQEASCPIFDMFLEYLLQRPTTALSASLRQFYIVSPCGLCCHETQKIGMQYQLDLPKCYEMNCLVVVSVQ